MSTNIKNKTVWSIRVSPLLKRWFEEYAKERCTDPQEEARQALALFREKHIQIPKKQEPSDG
jgi:predicted transcriptional regulator